MGSRSIASIFVKFAFKASAFQCRTQTPPLNFPAHVESPLLTIDDNLDRVLFLYSNYNKKSPTNLKKNNLLQEIWLST